MICSDEFQSRLIHLLLESFPEKRRLTHIHIPKSAGTHFFARVAPLYPCINKLIEIPDWTSKQELMEILAGFASIVDFFDFLMVQGHLTLNYLIREVGLRFGDEISTVLRDPVMSAISMANYIASRLMADPMGIILIRGSGWTTSAWTVCPRIGPRRASGQWRSPPFQDDRITCVNPICCCLGDGTSESAINNIVINNVELTDTLRYDRWLETRWNIPTASRINQSQPILNRGEVVSRLNDRLHYLCSEI